MDVGHRKAGMLTVLHPCWRSAPLSAQEDALIYETLAAHHRSALRANVSTVALQNAALGSNNYVQSIVAALVTLGGAHAPILNTIRFLRLPERERKESVEQHVVNGWRVPGWGNSFVQGRPDPIWERVQQLLEKTWPDIWEAISKTTEWLHKLNKQVWPNPSAYTAAAAMALNIPEHLAEYLFVVGRISAWTALWAGQEKVERT